MSLADIQRRLGVEPDGRWGPETEGAIAAILAKAGIPIAKSKTIADFIAGFIDAHEGGLSMDPKDNGNWTGNARGVGVLVGSKYGVTSRALAAYRGVKQSTITAADIASISRATAIDIGVTLYYRRPGFDRLPFNRITLSIVDKGWGSGQARAIMLMQQMIGAKVDGAIGPDTISKYNKFLADNGEEKAAIIWANVRKKFDKSITENEGPDDPDKRYLNGWNNRTDSFLPGTKWWAEWA